MRKKEKWKEISWSKGAYSVSTFGRVMANPRKVSFGKQERWVDRKILIPRDSGNGYKSVQINGKSYYIHRLVAEQFIPNPMMYGEVNHIDENKSNNSVDNLEWCSRKYNQNYGTCTQRARNSRIKDKFEIRNVETGEVYESPIDAYKKTGIHNNSISRACRNNTTAGGFHWEYINAGYSA